MITTFGALLKQTLTLWTLHPQILVPQLLPSLALCLWELDSSEAALSQVSISAGLALTESWGLRKGVSVNQVAPGHLHSVCCFFLLTTGL